MAISRREILKRGVSYGTGVINHGNDSIVYDRELRKFPQAGCYGEMRSAIEAGDTPRALEAAKVFRQLCGNLAMSSLYTKCAPVIRALEEECLPPVEDLEKLEGDYASLVDYLSHA